MRFKNTIRLFLENFKNVYKILLCKLVIGAVAAAILCSFMLPAVMQVRESVEWQTLKDAITDFIFVMFPGHEGDFATSKAILFNDALPAFGGYLWTKAGEIVGISIGLILVYLIARFAESVCYFSVADTLDDKMQMYGRMTFSSSLVKNFGRASKYSLVYVPLTFLFDLVIVGVCYLCLAAFKIFFGLFFSMILIVLLQSLKLTVCCFWMPAMTTDKKTLKEGMQVWKKEGKGQFWKTFSVYVMLVYLIIVLNVLAVLCTLASGLILTVPMSFFALMCFQYVNYYTVQGRRYFITFDSIAFNEDKGNSEQFFDRVLRTELEKAERETGAQEEGNEPVQETAQTPDENK